jgi:hypothetical protein
MKAILLLITLIALSGCASGFSVIQPGEGKEIEPSRLAQLQSGSLSTVWYEGSDDEFHYFTHFVKTKTKYKVSRNELNWPDEFPSSEGRSVFAGYKLLETPEIQSR